MVFMVRLAAQQPPSEPASVESRTSGHRVQREPLTIGARTIDLTLSVPADTAAADAGMLRSATRAALARLDAWLGAFPAPALTVIELPWHAGVAGASHPGVVVTSRRWLSPSRDAAFERSLLAALARQYTLSVAARGDAHAAFEKGLALYIAARLIREQLHGRDFETPRFFGGFVSFPLRSLLNSLPPEDPRPALLRASDLEPPAAEPARRLAAALQTFERHLGWPAFQQVLEQFMARFGGRPAAATDLAAVASDVTGRDLSTFFDHGTLDSLFDYAIADFRSEADADGFATTLIVRRAGRAAPIDVPLLLRFADGTEVLEHIRARDAEHTVVYHSAARAVLASVDPEAVLVIDRNRENNTRADPRWTNRIGLRLALHWMTWLQHAMLTSTAML